MSVFLRALVALASLILSCAFASAAGPNGPGGLRFLVAKPNAAWNAGSKQRIKLDGPATHGALAIRYRWMDEKSTLLLSGFVRKDARNEWSDEILVPMYSVKGHPHLILEVAKGQSKTWIFRSGKEFNLPPIRGLVIDNQPPVVSNRQFNEDKTGHWIELEVVDASGVSQALLVVGANKDSKVIEGACKLIKDKTSCLYYMPEDPKGIPLTAQIVDLAGNRTIASIQKGGKK
jgi:hypothetical protein